MLDTDVVERLERLGAATGEDLMAQLADLFLADADDRVAELRDALEQGHAALVSEVAHTFGAGANIGATDLARVCAWLETHGEPAT